MDRPKLTDRGHRWLTLAGLPLLWVAVLSPWDRIFQEAMLIGLLAVALHGKHQQRQTTFSSFHQVASWFLLGPVITIIVGLGWDFWRGQSPLERSSVFWALIFTGFPLLWGLVLWLNFSGPAAKKLSPSALWGLILFHTFIGWAAWTTFSSQNPNGLSPLSSRNPWPMFFFWPWFSQPRVFIRSSSPGSSRLFLAFSYCFPWQDWEPRFLGFSLKQIPGSKHAI